MELTAAQLLIIGVVASGITAAIKLIAARMGKLPEKGVLTVICAGVSLVLAVVFNLPELPAYVDPIQYLNAWAGIVSVYVGAATIIYNIVVDKVLDALNLTAERFFKAR